MFSGEGIRTQEVHYLEFFPSCYLFISSAYLTGQCGLVSTYVERNKSEWETGWAQARGVEVRSELRISAGSLAGACLAAQPGGQAPPTPAPGTAHLAPPLRLQPALQGSGSTLCTPSPASQGASGAPGLAADPRSRRISLGSRACGQPLLQQLQLL